MKPKPILSPVRTAIIYVLFGSLWILSSDTILGMFISHESAAYPLGQTIKGWAYILISALLLYIVLKGDANALGKQEEELRKSQSLYSELFHSNPQPMWVYDLETLRFLMVNDAAIEHYGYTQEEFLAMTIKDIRPEAEISALLANLAQPPKRLEKSSGWIHRKKDGTLIDMEISSHAITFEGRAARMVLANDVTERKQMEDALHSSEAQFRTLVEQLPAITYIASLDEASSTVYISPQVERILGISPEEYVSEPGIWLQQLHPDDRERVLHELAKSHKNSTPFNSEYRIISKQGAVIWISDSANIVRDDAGKMLFLEGFMLDITERKQAEEALRVSEENYRNLAETSNSAIAVLSRDGKILYANPTSLRIWNDPKLAGKTVHDLFPKKLADGYVSVIQRVIDDHIVDQNELETRVNGRVMWFHVSMMPLKNSNGSVNTLLLNAWDLTERKQADEALQASEKRFRALIEHGQDNISLLNADGILLWESPSETHMLGYAHDEFKGHNIFDLVHPDDLKQVQAQFAEVLAAPGKVGKGIFRLKHADGTWRWVEGIGANLLHEPSVGAIVINYRDVTERKQAEEARRQSEILFFKVFRSSPLGINIFRLSDGRSFNVNDAFLEIIGYSREELIGHSGVELDFYVDVDARNEWIRSLNEGGRILNQDAKLRRKSGEIRDCLVSLDTIEINNEPMVLIVASDITERKQAEDLLKESEERYRTTLDTMFEGIQILDHDWHYVYVNEAVARQGLSTREKLLGHTIIEMYPGIEYTELFSVLRDCMTNHKVQRFENEFHFPDGTSGWFELNVQPAPQGIFILSIDITERKKAEEKLRRSEERFRLMAENIEEGFWITDPKDRTEIYLSPAIERIFGRNIDELSQKPGTFLESILPEDMPLVLANLENQRQGMATNMEYRIRHADGSVHWIWDRAFPVLKEDGSVNIVTGIITDITKRKETEVRIQTQLKRLSALSAIDSIINTSMDMRLTLDVFLRETIAQLNVDAADILLYNPALQALSYAQGYGFRSKNWGEGYLHLGEGLGGQAILTRQRVHISDLAQIKDDFVRQPLAIQEGFVAYFGIPLIAKGQIIGVLEVFHRSPLNPDSEWLDYLMTLAGQAGIAIDNAQLFQGLQRSNQELSMAYDATIAGWSHAMDLRDKETEGHTQRVTELTVELAERMGVDPHELVHIRRGALLHDIGKLGVPDQILLKPGKLTKEEWDIMHKHPLYARNMLMSIAYLQPALDIPYCHHEKWDGTGYPRGLKDTEIPFAARIFAVVDVWDALRSDRPYRDGWTAEKTRDYIQAESGKHFDPQVVEVFMQMLKEDSRF